MALVMEVADSIGGSHGDCADGKDESGGAGGCFSLSKLRDFSSGVQMDSVELAIRTAPLKSPSSNFCETLVASEL